MACKAWLEPFCLVSMHLTVGNNMLTEYLMGMGLARLQS